MPGKCTFRDEWIGKNEQYMKWLRPVKDDKYKAYCAICCSKFDVSHSGFASLKVHEKGKKHRQLAAAFLKGQQKISFNQSLRNKVSPQTRPKDGEVLQQVTKQTNKNQESRTLNSFVLNEKVARAEIIWAMNKVMCTFSNRGASKSSGLFPHMFPDSLIAEKFCMQKDKLGYMVTYGLGPYFQDMLCNILKNCDVFSIAVDESLNKISQKGQVDLIVRYWDESQDQTSTCYLTSAFLGHSTASDLFTGFTSALTDLGLSLKKIIQIEKDGPNVNLKFFRELQTYLCSMNDENESGLIDTGTCCLHIVHGAYKNAHFSCDWNVNSFLRSIYYLFKDFPSRRADFIYHTGSSAFALKMCSIRWLENMKVSKRAIEMIPNLKKYINAVSANPPNSENFHLVKKFLLDELLLAKLSFLQSVTAELEPFLRQFQADKPLLPFLHASYYKIMLGIAQRILKKDVISSVKNAKQLILIDVEKTQNLLHFKDVDIGFATMSYCRKLKEGKVLNFQQDCKKFLRVLFMKLSKKSPLLNRMVRGASCLSPTVMLTSNLKEIRLTSALEEFTTKNLISGVEADNVKIYLQLSEDKTFREELQSFSIEKDRIDTFFMKASKNVQGLPVSDLKNILMFVKKYV